MDDRTVIAHLINALVIAEMAIKQEESLDTRLGANSPTIKEVIDRALSYARIYELEEAEKIRKEN